MKVVNENGVQAVEFEDGTVIAVFHDLSKNYEASDGRVITATEVNRIVISYAK